MDQRLAPAPIVAIFARAVQPLAGVVGFYAGGSLATGDFQPAVSDLDLVAVIDRRLDRHRRRELRQLHRQASRQHPAAARLHCFYVPQDEVDDVGAAHLTWAHGRLFDRPLSGIARAELLREGITVSGPPPSTWLPPIGPAAVRAAARAELTGYWSTALRRPWRWRHDVIVDLGLLTLARAEVTLAEDRLITKREALDRLHRLGVPPDLVAQLARRRRGEHVPLEPWQRLRRAGRVRHLCAVGIRDLLEKHQSVPPSGGGPPRPEAMPPSRALSPARRPAPRRRQGRTGDAQSSPC